MTQGLLSEDMVDVVSTFPGSYITAVQGDATPILTRVVGLEVEDRDTVVVAVQTPISGEFLACLDSNPTVALVGVKLTTFLTFQFKGEILGRWDATDEDKPKIQEYIDGFSALVAHVGLDPTRYGPAFSKGPWTCLRMRINEVFDQTPRVGAGNRIKQREDA